MIKDIMMNKIKPLNCISWDRAKYTTVLCNGCFDLVHAGHVSMLAAAKDIGDILIVAVNSDISVQNYKDTRRPILPLKDRMDILSAFSFVDYITWFDETNPLQVKFMPMVDNLSTTNIIDTILQKYKD